MSLLPKRQFLTINRTILQIVSGLQPHQFRLRIKLISDTTISNKLIHFSWS